MNKRLLLDFLGMSASALCAMHCLALPLLLAGSSLGGWQFLTSELYETLFLVFAAFIAAVALYPAYRRHQDRKPLTLAITGLLLLFFSHILGHELNNYWAEAAGAAFGGLLLVAAHFSNYRLVHKHI